MTPSPSATPLKMTGALNGMPACVNFIDLLGLHHLAVNVSLTGSTANGYGGTNRRRYQSHRHDLLANITSSPTAAPPTL